MKLSILILKKKKIVTKKEKKENEMNKSWKSKKRKSINKQLPLVKI